MTTKFRRLGRAVYAVLALAVASVALVPALVQPASAAQVANRHITMSSASNTATGVTYDVNFIPQAATSLGGIVVDFCTESPLIGDTACTDPTGFTMGATPSVTVNSGIGVGGSWVTTSSLQCSAAAGQTQVLLLTNATAQAPTLAGTTPIDFTITGITNPTSTPGTFYARILTFDTAAHATAQYTCPTGTTRNASFANQVDYGGVALTTVSSISITAKVMEQITFCVTGGAAPNDDTTGACTNTGGLVAPNLTIGHGTTTKALDSTAVDTAFAFTEISTNASHGVSVRMKSSNACTNGGLSTDGGTTCPIEGVGAYSGGATTSATISAGINNANPGGAFGMCIHKETGSTATAIAPYDDSINSCPEVGSHTYPFNATSKYGMDGSNTTGTTSTYGSQIFTEPGAVLEHVNTCVFAATAALVTPAGIYTTNESLIATGTF